MGNKESTKTRNRVYPKKQSKPRMLDDLELLKENVEDSTEVVPKKVSLCHETISLNVACREGYFQVACLILEKEENVDVNFQDKDGWSPLMLASKGGHKDIVGILLKHNVCLDLQGKDGNTCLIIACGEGNSDIIELLLQNGASVNLPNDEGETALHIACSMGYLECVKVLMVHNPDTTLLTKSMESPLDIAKKENHLEIVTALIENETVVHSSQEEVESVIRTSKHSQIEQLYYYK